MKKLFILLLVVLVSSILQAKKIAELSEISKPDMMAINNERLYITEKASIFIYSMKDFKLAKQFGKEGEGPKEFKISPFGTPLIINTLDKRLFVSSMGRISIFTQDGEFIEEFRVLPYQIYYPLENGYIYSANAANERNQLVITINLCDAKFEKIKELYKSDISVGPGASYNFPFNSLDFSAYKGKIYGVVGKEGFAIDVFNNSGNKLYRIKKNYPLLQLSEEYKSKTEEWFKKDPNWKNFYDVIKKQISFKLTYPPIRSMRVTDDRIYVLTYKRKNDDTECIILDLKGNELKSTFVPFPEVFGMDMVPKYTIYKKGFYTLRENEEKENWELHLVGIK